MRTIGAVLTVAAAILAARSWWVWERCGYDCGIFSDGPAAITGAFASVALLIVALCVLVLHVLRNRRRTARAN
jgi:hypothetical protein